MNKKALLVLILTSLAIPLEGFAGEVGDLQPIGTMGKGQRVLKKSFSAYRFHDDDPIFFQDGLRLTCRCGETEHGQTGGKEGYLNPPKTRYTTYTWVYQW